MIATFRRVAELIDPDELVGAAEIADRLRVAHVETIHTWRRRHADFPQPRVRLQRAMLFYWPDVEAWAKKTGRLSADSSSIPVIRRELLISGDRALVVREESVPELVSFLRRE